MQVAKLMVSLAGDTGNQVYKENVTPTEAALLEAIHGRGALSEIEPTGEAKSLEFPDKKRTEAEERRRLTLEYGGAKDAGGHRYFDLLFPGMGAKLLSNFSDVDLDESQYKAKDRVDPEDDVDDDGADKDPLDDMTKAQLVEEAEKRGVDVDRASTKANILAKLKSEQAGGQKPAGDLMS